MQSFLANLSLIARRMRANWRLLSVVGVGVLVASVLMASTTIYTRALSDLGLDFQLENRVGESGSVSAILPGVPAGGQRSDAARQFTQQSLDVHFGDLAADRASGAVSRAFTIEIATFANAFAPGAALASLSDLEERTTLVEGRYAEPAQVIADPESGLQILVGPIEVVIPAPQQARSGLEPGDTITLIDSFDECDREPPPGPGGPPPPPRPPCAPSHQVSVSWTAEVVGVVDRGGESAAIWSALGVPFFSAPTTPVLGPVFTLLAHNDTLITSLAVVYPGQLLQTVWVDPLPVEGFDVSVLDSTQAAFDNLRGDLRTVGGFVLSPVESTLDAFEVDLNFTEVPILLLLIQIVAIVLFYIVIVATMLVEREETEIALLRSRGASLRQMLSLYGVEGVVLAVVAALAGPFIAVGVINLLGYTSTFEPITGGAAIPTTIEGIAFGLAAGGAAFAVLAILIPVAWVSRNATSELRKRAARPAGANVIQRYYLDLVFVLIAVGLILEANLKGSAFQRDSVGGLSADPLVLVTPTLYALAFSVVMLRLLPIAFRILTWLVRDRVGVALASALQQIVRNPGPTLRLTLLLMLGAALGTFAASYGGTVTRSFDERVRYEAGVDLRAALENFGERPPVQVKEILGEVDGVETVSTAYRGTASTAVAGEGGGLALEVLALEPDAAAELLWFGLNLADEPLSELLRAINARDVGAGIPIGSHDPETVSLWARPTPDRADMIVWLRLRDGRGTYTRVRMGSLDLGAEWQKLSADLGEQLRSTNAEPPYSIHSVFLTEAFGGTFGDPGHILFDDLVVTSGEGEPELLEGFEGPGLGWERILIRTDRLDRIEQFETDDAISGDNTLKFTWALGSAIGRRGFFKQDDVLCQSGTSCLIPVIASSSFLDARGLEIGAQTTIRIRDLLVPVVIRNRADFFSTLEPDNGGFMVINIDHLYYFSAIQDLEPVISPNEAWFRGPDDPELREALIRTLSFRPFRLTQFVDQQELLAEQGSDPLTAAGGSGILLVSFVAVGALIALAFLVTVYITAQRRMVEMAIRRTLGTSGRQILAQLSAEYLIVVAIGLGVGMVLGRFITGLMLSFLEVTELGRAVRPPFVTDTDWEVVIASYLGLFVVFVIGVSGAWRFFARLDLGRVLRLSE